MQIQQIRNAMLKITFGGKTFLTDPWLAPKGSMGCFADMPMRCVDATKEHIPMPMCDLPMPLETILAGVDAYIITHIHPDHIDMTPTGIGEPLKKTTPAFVQSNEDAEALLKNGFTDVTVLFENSSLHKVQLIKTPGRHGTKIPCGPSCGVILKTPGEKTLYIAGDTIWYDGVKDTLLKFKPDIIIVNACGATLVNFGRLIMHAEDVAQVHSTLPSAKIIVSHMDNVAHATVTRKDMRMSLQDLFAQHIAIMPEDGETIEL